ncbi:hypothetical protein ANRL1_02867 [Anaerolineae bacterium]|nr:hypothetical protein ANRL1_02867 [Anaerolineae bacterium]
MVSRGVWVQGQLGQAAKELNMRSLIYSSVFVIAIWMLAACDAKDWAPSGVPTAPPYPQNISQARQTERAAQENLSAYLTVEAQKTSDARTATAAPRQTSDARTATAASEQTAVLARQTQVAWQETVAAQKASDARTATAIPQQTSVAATATAIPLQTSTAQTATAIPSQTNTAATIIADNKTATRVIELTTATAIASATYAANAERTAIAVPTKEYEAKVHANELKRLDVEGQIIGLIVVVCYVGAFSLAVVVVWLIIRFAGAWIWRLRSHYDPVRGPTFSGEPKWFGVFGPHTLEQPAMLSAPVTIIDGEKVTSAGGDPRFAARQTEVQMVAAASQGGRGDDALDAVIQRADGIAKIEPGDSQAQSLLPPNAKAALDGEWKVLSSDAE